MPILLKDIGKIERACGGDLKPALANPYLKITETIVGRGKSRKVTRTGTLCASDSYIAIQKNTIAVDDDETAGVVPLAAIKYARSEKASAVKLVGDRAIVLRGGSNEIASFPRGDVPEFPELSKQFDQGAPKLVLGLNPRLLLSAAEALGCDSRQGLRVEIHDPLKPVIVSVLGDDARAIVMPIRVAP